MLSGIKEVMCTLKENIEDNIKSNNYNIILVDTNNIFNIINRKYILCTIRYR